MITTVGPYLTYGEPLVAACAEAGTDYVDLTGEPEFVDRMYVAHHATAERTGARIVHACGFDSIPHDLGAYYTVQQLGASGPITMRGVVRAGAHVLRRHLPLRDDAFSRARQMREAHAGAAHAPSRSPPRAGRRARSPASRTATRCSATGCCRSRPSTRSIVARSGAALAAYGPKFRYSHYAGTKTLRYAVGGAAGVSAIAVAAQVKPVRNLLLGKIKQGEGPDAAKREKSWFRVDFVGEGDGGTIHTRVSGGDPGYTETAKMLAESALCLAFDDNPTTAGQVTTAQAMGDHLMARLEKAGIRFEVIG